MYDGYFDKWSHSWLPTPTNPLSPIFAALDPYWLERKHSEDRPYTISGPMFEENTPWGAVLNPTIGNILKPEKELHDDDYFFFGRLQNGIDILSLMKNANDSIRARARNFIGNNYISIRNGDITAVDWNAYNAPTPDTQVLSLENRGSIGTIHTGIYGVYGDGSAISGIGSSNGAATNGQFENKIGSAIGGGSAQDISAGFNAFSDDNKIGLHLLTPGDDPTVSEIIREALFLSDKSLARHGDIVQNEKGELGIYHSRRLGHPSYKPYLTKDSNDIFNIEDYRFGTDLSIKQRLEIEYVTQDMDQYTSLSMLQLLDRFNPRNIVRDLNQQIIKSGQRRDYVDSPYNVDESEGFTSVKKLSSFRPSTAMELLNDPNMVSDLITQGQGADLVENMAQTARLIGGIYGYMGSELGPLQRDESKRLQQSSDMTSYTRQFWDQNLGGLGGSISEIGRRFIPNFSRMNKVSPLLNTMPDWLPEKFRYGDAFCITDFTLVETQNMQFTEAKNVIMLQDLVTHTGKHEKVQGISVRDIENTEKLYRFTVSSLASIDSTYSENHPILTYESTPKTLSENKGHEKQELSKFRRYNDIISCLSEGITKKRDISIITGIDIDWLSKYLRDLYKMNMIEDYKKDKFVIYPIYKNLKLFDLHLLGHRLKWKKAKDIKVGDYVAYPIPEYIEGTVVVDLKEIIPYIASDIYIYTSSQYKKQDFVEAYEWLEKQSHIPEFRYGERKEFLCNKHWSASSYEAAQSMVKNGKIPKRMPRYVTLTSEVCYAIGLYLAEGYSSKAGINYALNIREKALFDRAVNALRDAGFCLNSTWKPIKGTNGAIGYIFCTALKPFMDYLVGRLAHNKCLNDILWNLQKDNLLRLFEGYIDGDGFNHTILSGQNNRESYRVGIASCNLKLLLQIRKLALRFGVIFKIQSKGIPNRPVFINGKQVNTGINYNAFIIGQSAVEFAKLLWGIDIQLPEWKKSAPRHAFIYEDYVYMRVQNIEEFTKEDYPVVYGFEMQDDKSFCTAGVATHNTSIPHGEMRLPGKGYESVNDLHPDQFSTEEDPYGAFDRMKILADVAPNSAEYKLWRNIASKTVIDPELRDEMEDIKSRARQQGKKHDFYDYNVIGQDLNYENVVVSEILDYGKFRSGNRVFKVAGVSVKANAEQSMKEVLGQYIHVGQEITIATDTNPAYGLNRDLQHSINAAVFVDGESVGNTMLESGDAVERKGDKSSAAKIGSLSALQYSIGYASEFLAHLDIPIISDQWLRVRSPYESYLAEQVYGTPYQSWSHPIDTFLMPAVERAIHDRSVLHNIASSAAWDILHKESIGGWTINPFGSEIKIPEYKLGRDVTHKIFMAHLLTDRAALVGTAVSNLFNANDIKMAQPSARHAERLVTAAHVLTGGNSMIDMGTYGAWLGNEAARIMEVDVPHRGKWWLGGTAAAMGYRLLIGQAGKEYVPDRVERNWDMQEYWDRLTYIKYEGLYKEAARRAEDEEGVDIEEAIEEMNEREAVRQNSIKQLKYLKKTLGEAYDGKTNAIKDHLLKLVNSRLDALASEESMVEGGKYTQTALIYKRAADSTMQGLHENAGWSQIVSALPQNDREYFMEFVAERDKDKREKILNIVSPSLGRALKMSWGMKTDKPISNEEYFEDHYLPDSDWAGWHPDVDLKDIEVKTINNEAMNLSDFGFYESQLRNPGAVAAAPLPYDEENDSINMSRELRRILKGKGLKNVEVDVVEKNTMGPTDIIANLGIWMGVNHQRHIENAMVT